MEALTQVAAARQPVKDAVYHYWLDKRKQLGKPLLRRLQAPTNSSDTNPHSCFRWCYDPQQMMCYTLTHSASQRRALLCATISVGCMYPIEFQLRRGQRCRVCSGCSGGGCRAREKINKPLLRNRRRGNDIDSLQKLQTIRQNQLDAIKVVHFLIKRERKKRDIAVRSSLHCFIMQAVLHLLLRRIALQLVPVHHII